MDLPEIVRQKSQLLLQLQMLRSEKKRRDYIRVATRGAVLESQIAYHYLDAKDFSNAVISFISEASCLAIAERWKEAMRVYEKSLQYATKSKTAAWIEREMERIGQYISTLDMLSPFNAPTNIETNTKLRRPQINAYIAAKTHFATETEHAIIQMPVGCGKSGTMAILPFHLSAGRVLVIAPNLEISRTLRKSFDYSNPENFWKRTSVLSNGYGPTCAVLESKANIHDCDNSDFIVTNIQQLVASESDKWLSQFPIDYFDMLLIDEGHHNVAPSWQKTIEHFPRAKKISFTATPLRSDGQKVEGKRIYRFPIADAIREGYIKDISSRRLEPIEISFTYKNQAKRHTLAEVAELREQDWFSKGVALSPECNRNIVDASITCMNELRNKGTVKHQIIAAACSIDHANAIRSLYAERGLKADVIHSKMDDADQKAVLHQLSSHALDVIVHVSMLGEGADYPTLSVAAIFRPYRNVVPYIQFVGRIMRVVKERIPGDPDNHGYVVSHFGLNIDRWWQELKGLDEDDQEFYQDIANGVKDFYVDEQQSASQVPKRRRFTSDMRVIDETIGYFIQHRFLAEDSKAMVDELIEAMSLRGFDPGSLGITREQLEKRILENQQGAERRGVHEPLNVQPQLARQEARKRLDERVRSGAKRLLDALGFTVVGYELVKKAPGTGANNISAAIILLNREVCLFLGVGTNERDTLSAEQCIRAHDAMDELIDRIIERLKG